MFVCVCVCVSTVICYSFIYLFSQLIILLENYLFPVGSQFDDSYNADHLLSFEWKNLPKYYRC